MLNMVLKCSKCKVEKLSTEDYEATLVVDFYDQTLEYTCPDCGNLNIIKVNNFSKKSNLPSIGTSKY